MIKSATVVDATGAAPQRAEVAIVDGRSASVGKLTGAARETVPTDGAWLTPGFVDVHTHCDGQATWDQTFSPSIDHGVTLRVAQPCRRSMFDSS